MFLILLSVAVPLRAQLVWTGQGTSSVVIDDANYYYVTDADNWGGMPLLGNGSEDVEFADVVDGNTSVLIPSGNSPLRNISFTNTEQDYYFNGTGGAVLTINGSLTASSNAHATMYDGFSVALNSGDHTATIGDGAMVTINGNITGPGSSITKEGNGSLVLGGMSNFNGGVTVNGGSLLLDGTHETPDGEGGYTYSSNTPVGSGTLTLNYGVTLAPISDTVLTNAVVLGGAVKLGDCNTCPAISFTGTISGTGSFDTHGNGDITFSGSNSDWSGGISFYGANSIYMGSGKALGTGAVHFDTYSDTTLVVNPGISGAIGSLSGGDDNYDAEIRLSSGASLTINQTSNETYGGIITGTNSGGNDGGIVKMGSGTLTLTGENSYYGDTQIKAGTLIADGSDCNYYQLGHGAVTIENGGTLELKDTYLINSTVTVQSGGKLTGYGNIGDGYMGAATTIQSGGILSPGIAACAPIGNLVFDHLTLQSGAIYEWNLQDPNGCAGTGWDLVSISNYTATLHIDSTTTLGSQLTLKLISLNGSGVAGAASGLVEYHTYTWKIFDGGGTAIAYANGSFDPTLFKIDSTGFLTGIGTGEGIFTLTTDAYSIYLNFTPVPEPSTYALLALGLGTTGLAAWRKRRRA